MNDSLRWKDPGNPADGRQPAAAGLDARLSRLAAAIAMQCAPLGVRNHILSEARRLKAARGGSLFSAKGSNGRLGTRLKFAGIGAAAIVAALVVAGSLHSPEPAEMALSTANVAAANAAAPLGASTSAPADNGNPAFTPATYYPLPYSDPSIANGTETTIQATVPASQLIAWGVPSLARNPDQEVPVSLVLGDDGLPRAIEVLPATASTPEESFP